MDALDVLTLVLRLALVVVLYAFLGLVMRGAARGLRPTARVADPPPPGAATELRLRVMEPGRSALRAGQVLELQHGAVLGRSPRVDVVIADPSVSAEHARVFRVGRAWVVSDLGSTNGTGVNDRRVDGELPLGPTDVLVLGSVRLQVVTR